MLSTYKRRRDKKTNYAKRLALLKSKKNRVVVRLSNLYLSLQYVEHKSAGDIIKFSILSKALKKFGWTKGFRNISACYLCGYLFAKEIAKKNLPKDCVLDLGLQNSFKGGRIFGCAKGMIDAGMKISVPEEMFPPEDRIKGKHIKLESLFETTLNSINTKYK